MWSWIIAIAIAAAGCEESEDAGLPVNPGGGGGTPVSGTGTIGGGNNVAILIGRVCLVAVDPRVLRTCDVPGANLVVSVGGVTTTTGSSGSFALPSPVVTTPPQIITVTGPSIVTTAQSITAGNIIPVLSSGLFTQVLSANGVVLPTGTGTILATVANNVGQPIIGVTATSNPFSAFGPFFDGATPTGFTLNGTGARGVVLIPGVNIGPASVSFTDSGASTETTVDGVQVVDGGLTLIDAVLP